MAKEERTIDMLITVTEQCIGEWTMVTLSSVASFILLRGCNKRHAKLTLDPRLGCRILMTPGLGIALKLVDEGRFLLVNGLF